MSVRDRAVGVDAGADAEQQLIVVALEAEHVGMVVAFLGLGDVAVDVRLLEPAVVADARAATSVGEASMLPLSEIIATWFLVVCGEVKVFAPVEVEKLHRAPRPSRRRSWRRP